MTQATARAGNFSASVVEHVQCEGHAPKAECDARTERLHAVHGVRERRRYADGHDAQCMAPCPGRRHTAFHTRVTVLLPGQLHAPHHIHPTPALLASLLSIPGRTASRV